VMSCSAVEALSENEDISCGIVATDLMTCDMNHRA
jgi:hypothetical protein